MVLRGFVLSTLVFLGCTTALHAQSIPAPPPLCTTSVSGDTGTITCPQGTSFYYDLGQVYDPLVAVFAQYSGIDGLFFKYSFAATGGSLPPGLTLSPNGVFSGTLTTAGTFDFSFTISISFGAGGMTIFSDSTANPAVFVVTPYSGPQVSVDSSALSFNLTANAAPVTESVAIANNGGQAVSFSASATTNSGGNWLTLSPTGSVGAFQSTALAISADPSHLAPGTYSGDITIDAGGQTLGISVLAVVSSSQPNIQLSQNGLRFQAVSGGTATSPQSITVLNSGGGTLSFAAAVSTISGGSWLNVSPASGTSTAKSAGSVTVSVNPAGLQPGDYYGTIQFAASAATNSPQVASVVLNVVSPANSPGAFVQPTGLIFVGAAGGTDPSAQAISITNPSPDALTFLATSFSNSNGSSGSGTSGLNWFTATPSSGSVSATQPATVSVQPTLSGLAAGVYTGDLAVTIVSSTSTTTPSTAPPQVYHIEVLFIVLPAGTALPTGSSLPDHSVDRPESRPHAAGCTPTQLLPVFTLLGTGFTAAVAWPTAIDVTVVDDCGTPLTSGSVNATFSSGDPALALNSLNNGHWTGTWNPTHAATGVTITAHAQEIQPALTGSAYIGGALQANAAAPAVSSGGVIGVFNSVANQPLAPGAYGAIYGSNLSEGLNVSAGYPFSLQLGGTSVILGGEKLPLYYTSANQINVVVPYDIPVNTTQQLVVQNGNAISIPQPVIIAAAQPTVLTQPNSSTAAFTQVYKADGTLLPDNSPVSSGDVIILYCTGLGAVDPPVAAGSPTPLSPLSNTVNPVTVTIGSAPPQVASFAGLTPAYVQLYQVNVQIPAGLPSGNATLTLSVSGQKSAPVTIAVQ